MRGQPWKSFNTTHGMACIPMCYYCKYIILQSEISTCFTKITFQRGTVSSFGTQSSCGRVWIVYVLFWDQLPSVWSPAQTFSLELNSCLVNLPTQRHRLSQCYCNPPPHSLRMHLNPPQCHEPRMPVQAPDRETALSLPPSPSPTNNGQPASNRVQAFFYSHRVVNK